MQAIKDWRLGSLSKRADVVVIGAGIFGCSVAFNLARRGCDHVIVLDRAEIGSGVTARGRGGIRKQFSTAANIRLSIRSFQILEEFERLTGVRPNLRRDGYLFLATSPSSLSVLNENLRLQQSLGVDVEQLSPSEIKDLVPELETRDVLGGNFCSSDGHIDNNMVLQGYVSAAKAVGVEFLEHSPVTGVQMEGAAVRGIRFLRGKIACDAVVMTAGPQSGEIGALCGVSIPVHPHKRQVFVTESVNPVPRLPLIVDMEQRLALAREGDGILMGTEDEAELPDDLTVEWSMVPRVLEKGTRRMPFLSGLRLRTGWAGYYEMTPDSNPIIGKIPPLRGLYCAAGFSGHGFMHAPAVGEILADLVLDGRTTTDIEPFRWQRFAEGTAAKERLVI